VLQDECLVGAEIMMKDGKKWTAIVVPVESGKCKQVACALRCSDRWWCAAFYFYFEGYNTVQNELRDCPTIQCH